MFSAIWLVLGALIFFILGYRIYGNFVSRRLGVDENRKTPAHEMSDGVDYVPAKAPVLLGHHFASIAGAAPIIGPVTAAAFGWLPVILWIIIGGIFIGAVHDFSSIIVSVRHQGRSIGEVIEERIGLEGKRLFLIFSFFALILVISAFFSIVAKTFVANPSAGRSSILFIVLAVLFGMVVYRKNAPLGLSTVIGVVLLLFCVYLGTQLPGELSEKAWLILIALYVVVAATVPVWILLQPRDYLNSFLLYMLMAGAIIGIFFANPAIQLEPVTSFSIDKGYLFPILFVTVACGAISGFHSLVGSGTTAKQLNSEKDAKLIGYGGMLIESLLAVVAIITAATLAKADYAAMLAESGPVAIFSDGVGRFMTHLHIPHDKGETFAALAVSAFALTTLDTATRLGRFAFQEFFTSKSAQKQSVLTTNRFIGTAVAAGLGFALAVSGSWETIWPLFGSANQLLAALAFMAISLWLGVRGIRYGFTLIPMIFMFAVTLSALVFVFLQNVRDGNYVLGVLSAGLLCVGVLLIALAFKRFGFKRTPGRESV
ncbi:carbon starvation protein A [candidate division KSB1 bacterium]